MSDDQPDPPNQSTARDFVPDSQPNNPLHGVTLKAMLEHLVDDYGWESLGDRISIRCFTHDPSIKSSLSFLRKTEWARSKVERLYLRSVRQATRSKPTRIERAEEATETEKPKVVFKRKRLPGKDQA